MIARQRIQEFADEVARRFHPDRIILFGSYAYGNPTEDSDVDLLVVMPHDGSSIAKAVEVRQAIRSGFPMDLLVYTDDYIKHRIEIEDFFLREITEKGEVLFEADHAGVG